MPSDDGWDLIALDMTEVGRVVECTTAIAEGMTMRVDPDDGPVEAGMRYLVGLELKIAPAHVPLDDASVVQHHLVLTTGQARALSADLVGALLAIAAETRHG